MILPLDLKFLALPFVYRLLITLAVLAVVVILAWWKKQLSVSGLIAAVILGTGTTLIGGFSSLSLYLFFLLSVAVIGHFSRRIRGLEKIHKKGGRRDWMQVVANGGPAFAAMVVYAFTSHPLFLAVFAACLGEACSDTWASEIGVLSHSEPVSILTFTKVPKGLSGGISLLGTSAAFLSSVFYGLFAVSCYRGIELPLVMVVILSSFAGVMADSFLGATVQAHFYNDKEDILTEHSKDREGNALKLVRGIRFMDNDMVNLLSNIIAFILCWSLGSVFI